MKEALSHIHPPAAHPPPPPISVIWNCLLLRSARCKSSIVRLYPVLPTTQWQWAMDKIWRTAYWPTLLYHVYIDFIGGGGSYNRLKVNFQPEDHISNCKLDSVVHADTRVLVWWVHLDLSCLDRTIYAQPFLGAKAPTQFCHRLAERNRSAERNHSDLFTDSKPASWLPNPLMPSWEAHTFQFSRLC